MDAQLIPYDLIVIGGGAAGFFSAICCAEARPGSRVLILEASPRVLTKVKVSGGGRCNVTHNLFEPQELVKRYPRGQKELLGPLHRFGPKDTIAWFAEHGVRLKAEDDGRMFPDTDSSQTIIDSLLSAQKAAGVELRTRALVQEIKKAEAGFELRLKEGQVLVSRYVMVATGSMPQGISLLAELGLELIDPVPSLFTFELAEDWLKALSGQSFTRVEAKLTIPGEKQTWTQSGPALITHWGMSGPAILRLSAFAARELYAHEYKAQLFVNWCGDWTLEKARQMLLELKQKAAKKNLSNEHPGDFSKRFWEALLQNLGLPLDKSWSQLSNKEIQSLAEALTATRLSVVGKGVFKEEFVTAGGVRRLDVDFRTMESRLCTGLYLAGEVLDIDGVTGGFNFQNAWTGGWIAAQDIAQKLEARA